MIHLQSAAGDALLLECLRNRPLLALDFDGTLSPLVPQPAAATMDPRVPPLLGPLMAMMPVAIVSGRGIVDLAARVPLTGVTLVGNHGNEWLPGERPSVSIDRASAGLDPGQVCLAWAADLAAPLAQMGEGIAFESKVLSLSIHYRLMADREMARLKLLELVSQLRPPPEIIEGKFVLNLMAPGLVTKYEAVEELQGRFGAGSVIFIGDDVTDERVFERAPPDWLTVRVWDDEANQGGEASAARACVHGVDGVIEVLGRLGRLSRNL
ncbi:MAG: trehalose-phosphatase [Lautropia sp.]|nr:trehalose-phosphatase [Lautropia sp.]